MKVPAKRLDAVVSKMFSISRSASKEAVLRGRVRVGGKVVKQPKLKVTTEDEISFRQSRLCLESPSASLAAVAGGTGGAGAEDRVWSAPRAFAPFQHVVMHKPAHTLVTTPHPTATAEDKRRNPLLERDTVYDVLRRGGVKEWQQQQQGGEQQQHEEGLGEEASGAAGSIYGKGRQFVSPLFHADLRAVGRLDFETTGLLLFTSDGMLLHRLTHPDFKVTKVYECFLRSPATPQDVLAMREGVLIRDTDHCLKRTRPAALLLPDPGNPRKAQLALQEGMHRQVRKMWDCRHNHVEHLHRLVFGPIALDGCQLPTATNGAKGGKLRQAGGPSAADSDAGAAAEAQSPLQAGRARALTQAEVQQLYDAVGLKNPLLP